jgi:hypothetical protein
VVRAVVNHHFPMMPRAIKLERLIKVSKVALANFGLELVKELVLVVVVLAQLVSTG